MPTKGEVLDRVGISYQELNGIIGEISSLRERMISILETLITLLTTEMPELWESKEAVGFKEGICIKLFELKIPRLKKCESVKEPIEFATIEVWLSKEGKIFRWISANSHEDRGLLTTGQMLAECGWSEVHFLETMITNLRRLTKEAHSE